MKLTWNGYEVNLLCIRGQWVARLIRQQRSYFRHRPGCWQDANGRPASDALTDHLEAALSCQDAGIRNGNSQHAGRNPQRLTVGLARPGTIKRKLMDANKRDWRD